MVKYKPNNKIRYCSTCERKFREYGVYAEEKQIRSLNCETCAEEKRNGQNKEKMLLL